MSTSTLSSHAPRNPRIALITGGSRGLGRAGALALAAQGVDLILTYQRQQADAQAVLEEARALGCRAVALQLDVAEAGRFPAFAQQVREALQHTWQRTQFDALVHNAGMGLPAAFADTTEAQFDALAAVHLKGPFFLTQALLPLLADGGRIVNVSSGLTRFSFPGHAAYAVMKGGLEVLTRYLAKELGPRGIAVNTLAPGAIATDFGGGAVRDDARLNAQLAAATAMGRVGQPDDIGRALASLLAEGNGWMTGQRIEVSGGMML